MSTYGSQYRRTTIVIEQTLYLVLGLPEPGGNFMNSNWLIPQVLPYLKDLTLDEVNGLLDTESSGWEFYMGDHVAALLGPDGWEFPGGAVLPSVADQRQAYVQSLQRQEESDEAAI